MNDKINYFWKYDRETMFEILNMYIMGISIEDISLWTKVIPEDINGILDTVTEGL